MEFVCTPTELRGCDGEGRAEPDGGKLIGINAIVTLVLV